MFWYCECLWSFLSHWRPCNYSWDCSRRWPPWRPPWCRPQQWRRWWRPRRGWSSWPRPGSDGRSPPGYHTAPPSPWPSQISRRCAGDRLRQCWPRHQMVCLWAREEFLSTRYSVQEVLVCVQWCRVGSWFEEETNPKCSQYMHLHRDRSLWHCPGHGKRNLINKNIIIRSYLETFCTAINQRNDGGLV